MQKIQDGGQQGEPKENEKQGGAVMYLHSLLEKVYRSDSPLEGKTKVFLFIQHQTIRDWETKRAISKKEISEATGVIDKRNLDKILKSLEKDEMILIHRSKTEKTWSENQYELHPKRFGTDFIYRTQKPTLKVHQGGKKDEKVLEVLSEEVASNRRKGSVCETQGVASNRRYETTEKQPPELEPSPLKNLLKEPLSKEPFSNAIQKPDYFNKSDWNQVREKLIESNPGEEKQIDKIYRELHQKKTDDLGRPIGCLPALMLSSYSKLKEAREPRTVHIPSVNRAEKRKEAPIELDKMDPMWAKFALQNTSERKYYENI